MESIKAGIIMISLTVRNQITDVVLLIIEHEAGYETQSIPLSVIT